ncbi:hypothetical protein RclHR1_00610023 [Rhizophagus clarus]|uniref:MIR domain-containing protein n=1 Tax=Rhizophagus clarus TaxID=94130 RepID=A0A2Z6RSH8_9GLOM|nr:hypothetical protein RclHR1_00610023 [Rhizophagus clarus]
MKTMMKFSVREWAELISDPITMKEQDQRVFRHADLPSGNEHFIRTPILLLTANKSSLHPRFTGNWDSNAGIWDFNDGLLLNEWYHIAYTLSDPEKRLDIYLDGEWIGYYSIQQVKPQKVVFNDAPLHIGRNSHHGFLMVKLAMFVISIGVYLLKKLGNDIWSVIGASGKNIKEGDSVSLNNIIGLNIQATGCYLHSHDTQHGKVTPISKQQQVTICPGGGNIDDDWLIRRYNPNISYDIVI